MAIPVTVAQLQEAYFSDHLIGASAGTREQHAVALGHFERWLGRAARLPDLNSRNLTGMMQSLLAAGRAKPTINGYKSKLCAAWEWGWRQGWIGKGPSVKKLIEPRRVPVALRPDEIGRMWDNVQGLCGFLCGVPERIYWSTYLLFSWDTGERHGAKMRLTWDHFDRAVIPAEIRKGGRADMPIELHADSLPYFSELRQHTDGRLWPWRYNRSYFWKRFGKLLDSCGIPNDRQHKTHILRRSHATHLVIAGGDATKSLGHSSPLTTQRYLDTTQIKTATAASLLPRPWEMGRAG